MSAGELFVVVLLGLALVIGGVVWSGAALASAIGDSMCEASLADASGAIAQLGSTPADPAAAWSDDAGLAVVDPLLYWVCTAMAFAAAAGLVLVGLRIGAWAELGQFLADLLLSTPGRSLHVDLKPLIVSGPEPGRFVLGWSGRDLLAICALRGRCPRAGG